MRGRAYWYFLKNCLKGHLRRVGRQLTYGPGVPYIPAAAWREYLKHYTPGQKLLGDVENWDELDASQSIIVGSPETVIRRISGLIERAKVGNLLIQFQLGNMPDSSRAQEHEAVRRESCAGVAPPVVAAVHRRISRRQRRIIGGGTPLSERTININGRKVWVLENGDRTPLLYLHGFADVHSVKEKTGCHFTSNSPQARA